jgi:two-component system, NarL family, sensor kinase
MVTTNVSIALVSLAISVGMLSFQFWKSFRLNSELKLLKAKLKRDEFEIASKIIEGERKRISAELHDDVGSSLNVIHRDLETVMNEASSLTLLAVTKLAEAEKELSRVNSLIRKSAWNLAAEMFDETTLGSLVREQCQKYDRTKGVRVIFMQGGTTVPLTKDFKLHLFRIVQEILTNCTRHSAAQHIGVHIQWEDNGVSITIDDDGVSYEEPRQSEGMGLLNISRRVENLGATLKREKFFKGNRVILDVKFFN